MKEDQTKHIVEESLLKTSDGFTDALMQKLEQKPAEIKVSRLPLVFVSILAIVFIGSLMYFLSKGTPELNFLDFNLKIPALILQIIGSLFILYIFNQVLNIYKNISQYRTA